MTTFKNSRKTRCDSVLDALTNEKKERLNLWLDEENRGYEEVRRLVAEEFGVATSRSALSRYFRRQCDVGRVTCDERLDSMGAEEVEAWRQLPAETARVIEGATLARARQLAFSEITMRDPDLRRVAKWMAIANKLERGQIERERMELEERRVALKERALAAKAERGARNVDGEDTEAAIDSEAGKAADAMGGAASREASGEESRTEAEAGRARGDSASISRIILDRAA